MLAMFGGTEFRLCLLLRFCANTNMTELKKSPPDPWVTDPIKNEAIPHIYLMNKTNLAINIKPIT